MGLCTLLNAIRALREKLALKPKTLDDNAMMMLMMMGGRGTPDRAYAVDDGRQVTRQIGRVLLKISWHWVP